MLAKYKDSLKNCFDALRNNKNQALKDDDIRKRLQNALFKTWMDHNKDNLKKYFDLLRENKKNADQEEKMNERIKNQMMNALQNN